MTSRVGLHVNGQAVEVDAHPTDTLLDVLRGQLGLKSVKRGCQMGECGACTVLLDGRPVCSCMILVGQVGGRKIQTVEGLQGKEPLFDMLVESFAAHDAAQCGYCTSGMLLVGYYLLRNYKTLSKEEITQSMSGNLCRCTGYEPIIDAVYDTFVAVSCGPSGRREE